MLQLMSRYTLSSVGDLYKSERAERVVKEDRHSLQERVPLRIGLAEESTDGAMSLMASVK